MFGWDVLCSPLGAGDLGIRHLRDFNISLLSKWWWKLLSYHQSPWIQVAHYIYYRQRRPLDLQDKISGCISLFWPGVLRIANAFKI